MRVADMHCDTVSLLLKQKAAGEHDSLFENRLHMDLQKMRAGEYLLQNFAMFVHQEETDQLYESCKAQAKLFAEEIRRNAQWIAHVRSYEEIMQAEKEGKLAALLTIEEGEACEGSLDKLREFYDLGVRMLTFTWNYDNSLSTSAAHREPVRPRNYQGSRPGLTELGIEFVECMEELGMIPDISHMSDEGIAELLQAAQKPFVASHSNARALCPHQRNLTDDFLKQLGEKGCVIGTNFYSEFLQAGADFSKTERIADHIFYMVDKAGIESVGLGSDFDGIDCGLELEDCSKIQQLAEVLRRRGMREGQIEKIFYQNVLRLYKEVL